MSIVKQAHKAVKIKGPGRIVVEAAAQIPQIEDGEVLVRVAAVAINPFDSKSADLSPSIGATIGCDYAGTIVTISSNAKTELQIDDRVCGWVFGNNPDRLDNGAFAEFTAAPADLLMKIPEKMSFEEAATYGVGVATAGMALYHTMQLTLPPSTQGSKRFVLVNGGATATGTLAIQMLHLSGFRPVATCSPKNFVMVEQLGCVAAFDYRSPTCASDIVSATNGELELALDCITTTDSMKLCYEAIGSSGGRYISLDPFPLRSHTRRSIKPETIVCLTQFGKAITKPYKRAARPQDKEFATRWYPLVQRLLAAGLLQPHPYQVMVGLNHVIDGIERIRKGQVAGTKLVYMLEANDCAQRESKLAH